jgi:hypothetical protein
MSRVLEVCREQRDSLRTWVEVADVRSSSTDMQIAGGQVSIHPENRLAAGVTLGRTTLSSHQATAHVAHLRN